MAKFDEDKTPFGLVPPEALAQIADVLGFGADNDYDSCN